jgi:hypothetical protein
VTRGRGGCGGEVRDDMAPGWTCVYNLKNNVNKIVENSMEC